MLSAYVHRRPLLRVLFALALCVGLLGTLAARQVGLTSGHSAVVAVDVVAGDLDTAELSDKVSAQDTVLDDVLDVPVVLAIPDVSLRQPRPITVHPVRLPWHVDSELRPPIV